MSVLQRQAKNYSLSGESEPSRGPQILVRAMWAEGNDLLAFQNIPVAGFGARAPALIGESLERCFRAQWRCYHIVSGLNGLPTVCLKGSHNDRDQLITATATHCTDSHQTLSWMNERLCAFIKIRVVRMGVLQHTHTDTQVKHNVFSGSASSMYALRMKTSVLSMHVQTQSAYSIAPLCCLFPPLCKTGISKDTLVPKHSAAMGGAPTCRHSMHTQQR